MNKIKQEKILKMFQEGRYKATAEGVMLSFSDRHNGLLEEGRHLSTRLARNGYVLVTLRSGSENRIDACLHQIIYLGIHGGFNPSLQINHRDGVKTNNKVDNLELVTPSQNKKHAHALGLERQDGEYNAFSKLNWAKVADIKILHASGTSKSYLATKFGVSYAAINDVIRGKTWRASKIRSGTR